MDSSMDTNPQPIQALTKRELLAGLALAGLLADSVTRDQAVTFAVIAADALLEELDK